VPIEELIERRLGPYYNSKDLFILIDRFPLISRVSYEMIRYMFADCLVTCIIGGVNLAIDNEEWLKLSNTRVRVIIIYYCILLVLGIVGSIFALLSELNKWVGITETSTIALIGSLSISTIGSSTFYIRKMYKKCINSEINQPGDGIGDKIQQLGVTVYFAIRPVFALGFSILVVIGLKAGMLTMAQNDSTLSVGFIYTAMFFSFFCGFSSGELINILERFGSTVLNNLFRANVEREGIKNESKFQKENNQKT